MARIRALHPGQWTDEGFVNCGFPARLLALAIRNEADDGGVFEWKPRQLKMRCLPADDCDILPLLAELEVNNLIKRFEIDGRHFGAIRNFCRYQRPKTPTLTHPRAEWVDAYVGLVSEIKASKVVETPPNAETPPPSPPVISSKSGNEPTSANPISTKAGNNPPSSQAISSKRRNVSANGGNRDSEDLGSWILDPGSESRKGERARKTDTEPVEPPPLPPPIPASPPKKVGSLEALRIDDELRQIAQTSGVDVASCLIEFADYCRANGRETGAKGFKDFRAAFANWLRREPKFREQRPASRAGNGSAGVSSTGPPRRRNFTAAEAQVEYLKERKPTP